MEMYSDVLKCMSECLGLQITIRVSNGDTVRVRVSH